MSEPLKAFPGLIPPEKPRDRPLSAAMERLYDFWNPYEDRSNGLYSNFKYSRVTGIGKEPGVSRRDPSTVIKVGDTYYVWYTKRQTESEPVGLEAQSDTLPAVDWDLADIWYATSRDGFHWEEQGIAVARAPKGEYGDRFLSTPSVPVYHGRYYLYYQTFTHRWELNDCVGMSMAWADSPDGPWHRLDRPVVPRGVVDEWDGCVIHDPFPLVYQGKIWLYYKGSPVDKSERALIRAQGVAIADKPEGPFIKSALNPVINSGHETCFFPFREGIAAIVSLDGAEKNTIQYAPDGLSFEIKSIIQVPPVAPGPFCPDLFADNGNGRGITWGLCHIHPDDTSGKGGCFLACFDCDLSLDVHRPEFKRNNLRFHEDTYFQRGMILPDSWRERILREQARLDRETIMVKD
ncbi:MAG: glycoside hydrolase [Chloroflexi bacterium]|nr:MAG: glycoside hydrolase [Chloroflexota bacterium]